MDAIGTDGRLRRRGSGGLLRRRGAACRCSRLGRELTSYSQALQRWFSMFPDTSLPVSTDAKTLGDLIDKHPFAQLSPLGILSRAYRAPYPREDGGSASGSESGSPLQQ